MIAALDPSQLTPLGRIDQAVGAVQHRTASAIWRGRRSAPDTFCIGVFEGRRQGLFCRLAIDCHSRYAGSSLYLNDALEVIGVRRSLRAAGRLVTSLEFEIAQLSEMQGWSGAHSGDCDRPYRPKVITGTGDHDHAVKPPGGPA